MATVTLRQIKGSPLTNAELDANLTNINAETVDNSTAYRLRPSLDVDLVGSKTVSPLLNFSRGSTGTYYDGKTAVKAEENLFQYSQEFDNAVWAKGNFSVTPNSTAAPDGTLTADTITEASGTTSNRITQLPYYSRTNDVSFSLYAKANTTNYISLQVAEEYNYQYFTATFDLNMGVVVGTQKTSGAVLYSANISAVGNGWYRICVSGISNNSANGTLSISLNSAPSGYIWNYTASGKSVYVWGAQLEQRSQPTAYTPTTTAPITNYIPQLLTAPTNTPRFDHDPMTGELKGMIVEESRTNLISYSEQFDLWVKYGALVHANVIVSPSGNLTGCKLIGGTPTEESYPAIINASYDLINFTSSVGSISVYAKQGELRYLVFSISRPSDNNNCGWVVDLQDTSNTRKFVERDSFPSRTITISPVGNGWSKITITGNTTTNSGYRYCLGVTDSLGTGTAPPVYTGNGVSGIYIWGAQVEFGPSATSYIPTPLTYTSRASTATYKGDDGYLKTAAINEARYERNALGGRQLLLEGAGSNSLTRTERFDFWNKDNCYVTPNITLAPDGTWTADKLSEDSQNTFHRIGQGSVTNGTTYTFSIYAKPAGRTKFIYGTDGAHFGLFTLEGNGTASIFQNAISVSIKAVSGGWYYCVVTLNSGTAPTLWLLNDAGDYIYQGDGSKGIYIWGAQIETGSVATSYMPSTETFTSRASTATYFNSSGVLTTAAIDTARTGYAYDASRNQWISQGLILEPAATNLLTYSDQFNNGAWSTQEASISPNAIIAPDGVQSADKLIAAATTQLHSVWRYTPGNLTNAICSVFAKKGEARYVALQPCVNVGATNAAIFDLETGQLTQKGSANSAGIIPIGNGWYRCWATTTNETLYNRFDIYVANAPTGSHFYQGDGTSGIYIWGAQLETGSVATSYIPTTSAQVTRAADVYTSTAGSRAADVYSSSVVTRSADQLSISKTSNWFNSVNGTLALAHDAASGQPLLGDGSTTILSSLGAGTINIDYSNSQLSVVTQSGQTTATQGIFNFDSDLQILGNSTTKANARIKYMKFYPNNVIGSTPEGSGFILDDGYAMLQEDGSVLFQE